MKSILLATVLVFTTLANAESQPQQELDFVCQSKANYQNRYPVRATLTQLSYGPIREDVKIPFQLELKEIRPIQQEVYVIPQVYKGHVVKEDVVVDFHASNGAVSMRIYLDELDQTIVEFPNGNKLYMDCAEHRW